MITKEKYSGMSREELLNQLQIINKLLDENGLSFSEYSDKDKIKYLNNYFRSIGIPEIYRFTDIDDPRLTNFYGIDYDVSRAKDIEYMDSIFNNETLIELFKFAKRFKDMYDLISLSYIDTVFDEKGYAQIELYDKLKAREYLIEINNDGGNIVIFNIVVNTYGFLEFNSESCSIEYNENDTFNSPLEFSICFEEKISIYDELAPKKIMDRIYKEFECIKDKIIEKLNKL